MKILDLFDVYLLAMMAIQGCIVAFVDAPKFKKKNMITVSRNARLIGIGSIAIICILFIIRSITANMQFTM